MARTLYNSQKRTLFKGLFCGAVGGAVGVGADGASDFVAGFEELKTESRQPRGGANKNAGTNKVLKYNSGME